MTLARPRDSVGSIGFEVLPFLVVLFVIGPLALLHGWAVIDAKLTVNAAAREATRALVEMPDDTPADEALNQALRVGRAAAGSPDDTTIQLTVNHPDPSSCRRVEVTASRTLEFPSLPMLRLPVRQVVRSTYSEVLDPHRDGLPGHRLCPS